MDDKSYKKEILSGLEDELARQKKFLASLKGWISKCQVNSKSLVNPLQMLVSEGETRRANLGKAIDAVKGQIESTAKKVV
jgi:hypothetical protein